jgi:hypothetical protein
MLNVYSIEEIVIRTLAVALLPKQKWYSMNKLFSKIHFLFKLSVVWSIKPSPALIPCF